MLFKCLKNTLGTIFVNFALALWKYRYRGQCFNTFQPVSEMIDIQNEYEKVGFPGCMRPVDCMKWTWKSCPSHLKGQYFNSRDSKSVPQYNVKVGVITVFIDGQGYPVLQVQKMS